MKRWIPLIALLCLALLPACAGALELAYQQPKEADLSGTNVNLRSAPSTGAQTLGRFADRADAGRAARRWFPAGHHGEFAEALMDLGSTICRPKAPRCVCSRAHATA